MGTFYSEMSPTAAAALAIYAVSALTELLIKCQGVPLCPLSLAS